MNKKTSLKGVKSLTSDTKELSINFHPTVKLAPHISYFFINYLPFVTANQITFLWGIIAFIGVFFIALGGYLNSIIGILIFHFAWVLDSVDGTVGRHAGKSKRNNLGGLWLDTVLHYVLRSSLIFAIGFGIFRMNGNIFYSYLGLILAIILMIDSLGKLKIYETLIHQNKVSLIEKNRKSIASQGDYELIFKGNFSEKLKAYTKEMLRIEHPFTLSFWAILFNVTPVYIIVMSVITPLFFIKNFINNYKQMRDIPFNSNRKK